MTNGSEVTISFSLPSGTSNFIGVKRGTRNNISDKTSDFFDQLASLGLIDLKNEYFQNSLKLIHFSRQFSLLAIKVDPNLSS